MCELAEIALVATAIPERGWRRWLWFGALGLVVAIAVLVAYLALV